MRVLAMVFTLAFLGNSALAQTARTVEIESRGQKIRAVLIEPEHPVGSVILLAGGNGRLDIVPQGTITKLAENQLIRTRAAYAKAGYAVLVPDIAPDMKTPSGVVQGYRNSPEFAQDLGEAIRFMRKIKSPVVMIGTSRGSLSVADALAHSQEGARPDAVVVSSAFLSPPAQKDLQMRKIARDDPKQFDLPMLVLEHRNDGCPETRPSNVEPFKEWYEKNGRKLDVIWMEGGLPPKSDACNALSAHGFYGLDEEVVAKTVAWINALNASPR